MSSIRELVENACSMTGMRLVLKDAVGGRYVLELLDGAGAVMSKSPPLPDSRMAGFVLGLVAGVDWAARMVEKELP